MEGSNNFFNKYNKLLEEAFLREGILSKSYSHKPHLADLPYDNRTTDELKISERKNAIKDQLKYYKDKLKKEKDKNKTLKKDFSSQKKEINTLFKNVDRTFKSMDSGLKDIKKDYSKGGVLENKERLADVKEMISDLKAVKQKWTSIKKDKNKKITNELYSSNILRNYGEKIYDFSGDLEKFNHKGKQKVFNWDIHWGDDLPKDTKKLSNVIQKQSHTMEELRVSNKEMDNINQIIQDFKEEQDKVS